MEAEQIQQRQVQPLSDTEVVRRVVSGEKELYEILMRRHNQKLYRVIRSYLKDAYEVEDAMQNTYLKAYEKLRQFREEAQFSTWLIRIGINEALSRLRQQEKLKAAFALQDDLSQYQVLQLPDLCMNPESNTIHNEMQQLLEKAIDGLPARYKVVYILHEVEEMSTSEITGCLGISESNAKVRLHRARTFLKERLYELSATRDIFTFGFKRCDRLVAKVMKALP